MKILDIPQSGKRGLNVSEGGRNGQISRILAIPSNPRSDAQMAVRHALSSAAAKWRTLTEEQRLAWIAAAKGRKSAPRLGQSGPLTGSQLFAISSSATAWEMWINGTDQGAAGGAYSAGGAQVVGSGSNGGTLDGDIAEIIEFSRALDATELNQMGSYLANKYALTTTYPPIGPTTPTATLTITDNRNGNVTIGGTVTHPTTGLTLHLWKSNDLKVWSDTGVTADASTGSFSFFPPEVMATDGTKTFYMVK